MPSERSSILVIVSIAGVFAAGSAALALPHYRAAVQTSCTADALQHRLENGAAELESCDRLAEQLKSTQMRYETELREIPLDPDTAGLMRSLTLPVDNATVIDQTFTAGRPSPVPKVEDGSIHALPLTIDMIASFDTVFGLLKSVESMPRLVRIGAVRIERHPEIDGVVMATIGLDSIYEVSVGPEEE